MHVLLHSLLCRSVCLIVFIVVGFTPLTAGPADTLGTAEVVSARLLRSIRSAIPVQRLDTADIRLRGMTDIGDALRRLSGVNLRDYGGAGGLKTVSVRGLGASHTQVVYDGMTVSDARQGQVDLQQFNLDRLARIELQTLDADRLLVPVSQLGAATLYLTSLQGGQSDRKFQGQASLRQASFNTWNPGLSLQYTTDRHTHIGVSGDYFFADNNYPFYIRNGVASLWQNRTNSRMQTGSAEINVGRKWTSGHWAAKLMGTHNDRQLPGQVRLYVNENDEQLKEQQWAAQLFYRQQRGRFQWFAGGKYHWERSHYSDIGGEYPGGSLHERYIQRENSLTAGLSYSLVPGLSLAYATDGVWNALNSNQAADNHVKRTSWLNSLSLQWKTERLNLMARGVANLYCNGRETGESGRNAHRFMPSLSASYRLISRPFLLYLRAGYKESFRMPTFTELYFRHYGSTDLRPELARQLSGGLTLQTLFGGRQPDFALTCDYYYNKVRDHIISMPYNLFVWRTLNLGEVRSQGADVTLNSRWSPTRGHTLLLSATYSYQQAYDNTPTESDAYGNQLPYTPRHSGSGALTWDNPWLSVVAHTTYSGKRWATLEHMPSTELEAYSEWGFAVFRSFTWNQVRLDARADLVNAFNRQYEIIRRYPMPGRAYKLAVTLSF